MAKVKPLVIPQSKKIPGLTVWCTRCHTTIGGICNENDKNISKCPFGESHKYKVLIHVPGTRNTRRSILLDTRNYNEAMAQAIAFRNAVTNAFKNNKEKNQATINHIVQAPILKNEKPTLIEVAAKYIAWMYGENVPEHRKKFRSKVFIAEVERSIKHFFECLKAKGYDHATFNVSELTDPIIGLFHEYLVEEKKMSPRTYNKMMSHWTSCIEYANNELDLGIRNWFKTVPRNKLYYNPQAITLDEFEALLKEVSEENGEKMYPDGRPRNVYRPFQEDMFRLGLYTGRRREELISMKYSHLIVEADGRMCLKVPDIKVNRIQKRKHNDQKFIYVPVTTELKEWLEEHMYKSKMNTDEYLIAPEIKEDRFAAIADATSKGFTHFYERLNTGRNLTFKSLRKKFITTAAMRGGSGKDLSGHDDNEVIEKHYIDQKQLALNSYDQQLYQTEKRFNQTQELRNHSTDIKQQIDK